VASHKTLLEKLLEQQRAKFDQWQAGCTCQYAARREAALQVPVPRSASEHL